MDRKTGKMEEETVVRFVVIRVMDFGVRQEIILEAQIFKAVQRDKASMRSLSKFFHQSSKQQHQKCHLMDSFTNQSRYSVLESQKYVFLSDLQSVQNRARRLP